MRSLQTSATGAVIATTSKRPGKPRRTVATHRDLKSHRNLTSNARIAIVMLLVAETMFFAGLIGAYLVFRFGSVAWPPPNLPRLPLGVTWANTAILATSGLTMVLALRAIQAGEQEKLQSRSSITLLLGVLFVGVQGSEWVRLIHHGLTLKTGTYGATFYTLIGAHALHVWAAVVWLGIVWLGAGRKRFSAENHVAVELCTVYWSFVCVLWLILFALVYH
jgi:heme/copper-type cytochrome/quinol oxidase subunit 3